MAYFKKIFFPAIAAVLGLSSLTSASHAATNAEIERDRLFQIMLADPDDMDAALKYAALVADLGDFEGAISTLERLLIFSPGNAVLQAELGVLYYKLGNFDTAESYLKAVQRQPGIPKALMANVEKYLAAIEKRLRRFRWSGKTLVGLRYQDNANLGLNSSNVVLNGNTVNLGPGFVKKSDIGIVTSSRAHFEYDFWTQGDRLELDYADFGTILFKNSNLSLALSEVTFGPSFNLGRFHLDETFLGVYGIANGALLGKNWFFGTLGGGVRLVNRPSNDLKLVFKGEFRRRWYHNSTLRPLLTSRNGIRLSGDAYVRYKLDPNVNLTFGGQLFRENLAAATSDHWGYGMWAQIGWNVYVPSVSKGLPWRLIAGAGFVHRRYRTNNPVISLTNKQRDRELWARARLEVPVNDSWAIVPKVEYRRVNSNYPTNDFGAFAATIGVQYSQ